MSGPDIPHGSSGGSFSEDEHHPPVAVLGRASFSNVYVLALGHADLPGETLIEGILNRTVQHVCLPISDSWLVNASPSDKDHAYREAFTGWLFLKVARRGSLNLSGCDYVQVAVKTLDDVAGRYDCDCPGGHDPVRMMHVGFAEVRRFSKVRVSYTHGRGPFVLPVGDEASRLEAALQRGLLVETDEARQKRHNSSRAEEKDKYGLTTYSTARIRWDMGKGTRQEERLRARLVRETKQLVGDPFRSRRTRRVGVDDNVCCESLQCSCKYRVTPDTNDGLDKMVSFRAWFRALDENKRRQFIGQRIRHVTDTEGNLHKQWMLESPTELQRMVRGVTQARIEVVNRDLTHVCGDFFAYVLGVAKNKMYQPTNPSPDYQTTTPRQTTGSSRSDTPGKAYWVVFWLVHLAQFYLHDPTSDRIILPFADKRAVYDMYLQEAEDEQVRAKWCPCGVPSRSWFYQAWTNDPAANHIKTRKTLRFSLCPLCVEFMTIRTHVLDEKERTKVKLREAAHHTFVRNERGSYYLRRHLAVVNPSTIFSIIIDGADQSAFGSPHFYTHSKGRHTNIQPHAVVVNTLPHMRTHRRRRALENRNASHGGVGAWPRVPRVPLPD